MSKRILNNEFIHRLETFSFNMPNPMLGYFGGNHRTKTYGQAVEFADFKEYVLGDDIRYIDWNLFARFEKYYIKQFIDERQMKIQIYIDGSASMTKIDNLKSEFALKIAASIGYLSLHSLDRLSFHVIKNDQVINIGKTLTTKEAFFRILPELEAIKFEKTANFKHAITNDLSISSNDGLSVIISDFLYDDDWKDAVDFLVHKKRSVLLVQVMSKEDINPFYSGRMRLLDSESVDVVDPKNMRLKITKGHIKAYEMALNDFFENIKKFSSSRGVNYVRALSHENIENFVFLKLGQAGLVK